MNNFMELIQNDDSENENNKKGKKNHFFNNYSFYFKLKKYIYFY